MNANQNGTNPQASDSGSDLFGEFAEFGRSVLTDLERWRTMFLGDQTASGPVGVIFRSLTVEGDPEKYLSNLLATVTETLGDALGSELNGFFRSAAQATDSTDTAPNQSPHQAADHSGCDQSNATTTASSDEPLNARPAPEHELARLRTLLTQRTAERDAANKAVEDLAWQNADLGARYEQCREWANILEVKLADANRALREVRAQFDSGAIAAQTRELCTHGMRFRDELLRRLGRVNINGFAEFGQHPMSGNLTISFDVSGLTLTYDCIKQQLWVNSSDGLVPAHFVHGVIETANEIINEQRSAKANPATNEDSCPDQPDLSAATTAKASPSNTTADNDPADEPDTVPAAGFAQAKVPSWDAIAGDVDRALRVGGALITITRILTGPAPASANR